MLNKCFYVNWDWTGFKAGEKFSLPLTVCPSCGREGGVAGMSYPQINLESMPGLPLHELRSDKHRCISWEKFVSLRNSVQAIVNLDEELPPGAALGPLFGKIPKTKDDLFGPDPWTLCVRNSAWVKLQSVGITDISVLPTAMTLPRGDVDPLMQVVLRRFFVFSEQSDYKYCAVCQNGSISLEKSLLSSSKLEQVPSVFKPNGHGCRVMCKESFRNAVIALGLKGLSFRPVNVVED